MFYSIFHYVMLSLKMLGVIHILFIMLSLKMLGVVISVRTSCNNLFVLLADGIANLFFIVYIL